MTGNYDLGPAAASLWNQGDKYEESGDFRNAFRCYLALAKMGHTSGQINVGNCYSSGQATRSNLRQAEYWYRQAYKSGDSTGALNLAVDKREQGNLRAAIFWFKKAVAMNGGSACVQLAKIYAAKKGGEKPAVELLRRVLPMSVDDASELDKKEAESLLRSLQGTGSKSRTKALRRSRRARR